MSDGHEAVHRAYDSTGQLAARARVERVKAAVGQAREDLIALWRERAWEVLGYASWEALCDAEFGVRMALPREERPAIVADLREQGMTTRAIGSALGTSEATVRRDLAGASFDAPAEVVGLDGKRYAGESAPRAEVQRAIERYPDLSAWEDKPAKVLLNADALDAIEDPAEKATRLDALAKTAAAQRAGLLDDIKVERPDPLPHRLVDLAIGVNRAAQNGIDEAALSDAAGASRDTWRRQFEEASTTLAALAAALGSTYIRRVQ